MERLLTSTGKNLIVIHGPSSSGKSTFAHNLNGHWPKFIFSTDEFFINETGQYVFDATKLHYAHKWNFRRFHEKATALGHCTIVIDNTNLSFMEFIPYWLIAYKNKFTGIYDVFTDVPNENVVQILVERNTHGVPVETIERQLRKLESLKQNFNYRTNAFLKLIKSLNDPWFDLALKSYKKAQDTISVALNGVNSSDVICSSLENNE